MDFMINILECLNKRLAHVVVSPYGPHVFLEQVEKNDIQADINMKSIFKSCFLG